LALVGGAFDYQRAGITIADLDRLLGGHDP
jgi:hypothetical protein